MDDLFGLSMNYIMLGLLAALGVSLATVAYVVPFTADIARGSIAPARPHDRRV